MTGRMGGTLPVQESWNKSDDSFHQMMESTADLLNILQYLVTENETCIMNSMTKCSNIKLLVDNVHETITKLKNEVKNYFCMYKY